jgi:MOSC domain-containing protein YiiM
VGGSACPSLAVKGLVLQVNLSPGGLPKRPVPEAFLTPLGFQGDSVAHPGIHGGVDKAVLLVAAEATDELIARGYPLFYGALGENLTTSGLDRRQLRPGMRLRAGEAFIELTRLRTPCTSLDVYGPQLKDEISHEDTAPGDPAWGMGGFYASVVQPGWVRARDIIWVVDAAV